MALKRAAPESFLFVRTSFDIGALIRYQRLLEDFIDDLPNRAQAWTSPDSPNAGAVLIYEGVVQSMMPAVLRSNYLASIWSLYESTVLDVAAFAGRTLKVAPLSWGPGVGFDKGTTKYYNDVLGFPRESDPTVIAELQVLYKLRNAIMHAGGRKSTVEPPKWAQLEALATQRGDFDVSSGIIAPSEELTNGMTHLAAGSLNGLVARARARLTGHV